MDTKLLKKSKSTLKILRSLRNEIAHRTPSISLSNIAKDFPDEIKTSKDQLYMELKKLLNSEDENLPRIEVEISRKVLLHISNWIDSLQNSIFIESIITQIIQFIPYLYSPKNNVKA